MFYRNIENFSISDHYRNNLSTTPNNDEYRERIKMKLIQIIGDRDFMDFIRDAVEELMAEL